MYYLILRHIALTSVSQVPFVGRKRNKKEEGGRKVTMSCLEFEPLGPGKYGAICLFPQNSIFQIIPDHGRPCALWKQAGSSGCRIMIC